MLRWGHMTEHNQESQAFTSAPVHTTSVLRSPITLLQDAWGIYTARFTTLLGISIIPELFTVIASMIGVFSFTESFQTAILAKEFNIAMMGPLTGMLILVVLAVTILIWAYAALLSAVTDPAARMGVVEAYRKGWSLLGSYVWINILTGLIVVVGFVLLLIPGIIVSVWFLFPSYVLAVEGVRGADALQKSKSYVQGHWWAVFGRLCAIYLAYFILFLVVGNIDSTLAAPVDFASMIVDLFAFPFLTVYMFLLYQDLKGLSTVSQ